MEIRLATTQDYDAIAALNAEVQAVHAEAEPQVFKPPSLDMFSRETFDAILSNPAQSIYIGCIGNTPIGYMFVEIRDEPESVARYRARYLIIHHLGVSAAHRGNGYGEQFHRAALALARAQGIQRVDLSVWAFNERAHAFYSKQGFRDMTLRMTLATSD